MKRVLILLLLSLSGCSTINRTALTDFEPVTNGFRYVATVRLEANWDVAEAKRMQWLKEHVAESGICPRGYKIRERIESMAGTPSATIYYFGTCSA